MADAFFAAAAERYDAANAATLQWMLGRPALHGVFLNTKLNPITLRDYTVDEGWRGPDFLYGWIQGRGLEALAAFAEYFEGRDEALASAADARAAALYLALDALVARFGQAYFCHDPALLPVHPDASGRAVPQVCAPEICTFADAFAAKGLIASAMRHAPREVARHLGYLARIVAAIEAGRFQLDERVPLGAAAVAAQPDDLGPRMILLGAAPIAAQAGGSAAADYAGRFIAHVLERHFDAPTRLLRSVPGDDACNVGHGIEFVGLALDHLPEAVDPALLAKLEAILLASFEAGFKGPGIVLAVSVSTRGELSPNCPWWIVVETIRAAALLHARTRSAASLEIWKKADAAFFNHYWRGSPPIAYQTLTAEGPVDFVPATPDLDPCYHTGLSLLAASKIAARLAASC